MGADGGDEPIVHFVLVHGASHGAWYFKDVWEKTMTYGSLHTDVILASKLLRPCPVRALRCIDKLPPNTEAEKVPRVYINTAKDNLCDPILQDRMVEKWPPSQFYTLEKSDHSAFFSIPTTLFIYLCALFSLQL
ncbi:unnamed protein product [Eruca vesicaria subsp. sativa]|uniref:Uncharacterized protein n=1 Tax=Eruca vesicaria subsp. sativa TaxID=29727 RepID=A0ABC8KXJ0_ERUVS|nr:unnamed protein product [Eruca vesicaria subsp. sativa]